MPKKVVKKVKEKSSKGAGNLGADEYVVKFNYNGKDEVFKGRDLVSIFDKWTPKVFKTIVLLEVKKGKTILQRRLPIIMAKRIAGNPTFSSIFANGLLKFLK